MQAEPVPGPHVPGAWDSLWEEELGWADWSKAPVTGAPRLSIHHSMPTGPERSRGSPTAG